MADNQKSTNEHTSEFVSLGSVFDPINDVNVEETSSQVASKLSNQISIPHEIFKLPAKKWNEIYGD